MSDQRDHLIFQVIMLAERQVTAVLNVQRQDYFCGLTGLNPLESMLQYKLGAEE
jgi:hypothetical protein